ncbi:MULTISPECIES: phosphotransferase enzyme family protein [Streptomyces]|uniref:phosphotransferase enzyme family protein n=1 Tax=Streptomyces TaxID=1883 RepID=UPI00067E3FFA|nr:MULTISPECIES: phosphotransferase [Streptomyces]KOT48396.1 aminoglycoside phosphotransferase [Streptomyces rimosus subsp. rimosus]
MTPGDDDVLTLDAALQQAYGIRTAAITRIRSGTATTNFYVRDRTGERWFAKVYCQQADLGRELAAVELAQFARDGGLPVPAVRPAHDGRLIARHGLLALSVWQYLDGTQTAEGGLYGQRCEAVGAALGRLHRRLAQHPASKPARQDGALVCDLPRARRRFAQLIDAYTRKPPRSSFERWALEAARVRHALLPRLAEILGDLPALTVQIVHGDLAAPNLLLRDDQVAGFIDFQPPTPRFVSWEIARIACDPRTVARGPDWLPGLVRLAAAYQAEHPAARADDLIHTVTVGSAYTLASAYPLSALLTAPETLDAALEAYGWARHTAGLMLLERRTEAREALRAVLR